MADGGVNLLGGYLSEAAAAEQSFEALFRNFSLVGDDDDVKAVFSEQAEGCRQRRAKLTDRLADLGYGNRNADSDLASILNVSPQLAVIDRAVEERTLQHLIVGYTLAAGGCAVYECIGASAKDVGDDATGSLAAEILRDRREAADKIWHFLPSRSKIAFNMLTVSEVDPAVETKAADNRLRDN